MPTAIRMSRGGTKSKPYYRIVVADSRSPRDGKFIERLGKYNPMLAKDDAKRVELNAERISYWLGTGAQPSETVARFLRTAGVLKTKPTFEAKPKGSKLKPKAAEALKAQQAKAAEAEEAKKAAEEAAKAPKEEPAAEAEAPAAEASAAE